jgi:Ala-tRNA(Pro) deacylase
MPQEVFARVQSLLEQAGVPFRVTTHEAVYTSEEAARVRGVPLSSGAKALICKGDAGFFMVVMPANLRLDSRLVRRQRGERRLRFARPEEVLELTGLTPGAIPPFGSLFGLPTVCDQRLGDNETINFNAADHAISVSMAFSDYVAVEQPELGTWAK